MKKSIFKAYWLVVLSICMLASCTSQKEEIETNNTTPNEIAARKNVRTRSTLPPVSDIYDLPAYIGALHNAGIYAFVEYVNENNLSPYTECDFTDEMIETFVNNYVNTMLTPVLDPFEFNMTVSTNILDLLSAEYNNIINSTSDIDEINIAILERTEDIYGIYGIEDEDAVIYDVIKEIAIATNTLWRLEWNFSQSCFNNPYLGYNNSRSNDNSDNSDNSDNGNNEGNNNEDNNNDENNNDQKSDDDLKKLTKADINGGIDGLVDGFLSGSDLRDKLVKAIIYGGTRAIGASIAEFIDQELTEHAIDLDAEDVVPHSYFHNYLLQFMENEPARFNELFGDKFNSIM